MSADAVPGGEIGCIVELYGLARVLVGQKLIEVRLPAGASVQDLLAELGARRPDLVGRVLRDDCSGVTEGQSLAINGLSFVEEPASVTLKHGDRVLILANAAGGLK